MFFVMKEHRNAFDVFSVIVGNKDPFQRIFYHFQFGCVIGSVEIIVKIRFNYHGLLKGHRALYLLSYRRKGYGVPIVRVALSRLPRLA